MTRRWLLFLAASTGAVSVGAWALTEVDRFGYFVGVFIISVIYLSALQLEDLDGREEN